MAFAYKGADQFSGQEWLRTHGIDENFERPLLGVTIIDWGAQYKRFENQSSYEIAIIEAIQHFICEYNGFVFLFPQSWGPTTYEDDRIPARRVRDHLKEYTEQLSIVNSPLSAAKLKGIYAEMDMFIGTRMHSNIFAWLGFVPALAVGYLHKTSGIAKMAFMDNWVIDIQEINSKLITDKVDRLWEARFDVRNELSKTIPCLASSAMEAGKIIATDYSQYKDEKTNG